MFEPTDTPLLRIGQLAAAAGVPAATLRTWETRYGVPVPARTTGGQRRYPGREVERVKAMRRFIEGGYAAGEAARLVAHTLPDEPRPGALGSGADIATLLTEGDLEAVRMLDRLAAVVAIEDLVTDVVAPIMREIGDRWARGVTNVAEEHAASALVATWLGGQARVSPPALRPGTVLTAAPEGERHELGLVMFGLFLRRQGVRVLHAGADLPASDLAALAGSRSPRCVCLAVLTEQGAAGLYDALEALEGHDCSLAVGGAWAPAARLPAGVTLLPDDLRRAAAIVTNLIAPPRTIA